MKALITVNISDENNVFAKDLRRRIDLLIDEQLEDSLVCWERPLSVGSNLQITEEEK